MRARGYGGNVEELLRRASQYYYTKETGTGGYTRQIQGLNGSKTTRKRRSEGNNKKFKK